MDSVLVPAGENKQGTSEVDVSSVKELYKVSTGLDWPGRFDGWLAQEMPAHRVTITRAFRIGRYPVMTREFAEFIEATAYCTDAERQGYGGGRDFDRHQWVKIAQADWRRPYGPGSEWFDYSDHPVVQVSWQDAVMFCAWLGEREHVRCRLPTEAEWERACRSGSDDVFWWGRGLPAFQRSSDFPGEPRASAAMRLGFDKAPFTTAVSEQPVNPLGIAGMVGGAWEWCNDWFSPSYYNSSGASDPRGPETGTTRVLRGGSWNACPFNLRSAYRYSEHPDFCHYGTGFRVLFEVG